jgi:hypothetical protein
MARGEMGRTELGVQGEASEERATLGKRETARQPKIRERRTLLGKRSAMAGAPNPARPWQSCARVLGGRFGWAERLGVERQGDGARAASTGEQQGREWREGEGDAAAMGDGWASVRERSRG